MPPRPKDSLFGHAKKGRLKIRPDLLPDLAAYLIVQLSSAEDAAKTQSRMQLSLPDGTQVTNPIYYRHAAGYLRRMLAHLPATLSAELVEEARQRWDESVKRAAEPTPTPGGEG